MSPSTCAKRFAEWWVVVAACAAAGPLSAQVDFGDDASQWARDGECDDPRFEGEGAAETLLDEDRGHDASDCRTLLNQGRLTIATMSDQSRSGGRVEHGWLQSGDATLKSGEFADTYTFKGTRGGQAVIDLRSGEFDPYLLVSAPNGAQFENDDYGGDASRSMLSLDLDQDGMYRITVTSYREGETGSYTVEITLPSVEQRLEPIDRRGALQASDDTLQSGEYVDSYDFDGIPGQHVAIELTSGDFDTYLILVDPNGKQTENDDAARSDHTARSDDVGHSVIEADLKQSGRYRVLVTSNKAGETGAYRLTIDRSQSGSPENARPSRDVATLTVGRPTSGMLEGSTDFATYQLVRTQGSQSGYQHWVVDRGSNSPLDVMFER